MLAMYMYVTYMMSVVVEAGDCGVLITLLAYHKRYLTTAAISTVAVEQVWYSNMFPDHPHDAEVWE